MTDCCLFGLELCYLLWVQVVLGSIPIIDLSRYKFNGLFILLNCFNFLASSCLAKHKLGAGGHRFIPLNGPFIIMLRGRLMHFLYHTEIMITQLSIWSRAMIPALGAGGPGFNLGMDLLSHECYWTFCSDKMFQYF